MLLRAAKLLLVAAALVDGAAVVSDLTESSFNTFIEKSDKGALVEFYAPWCGHCKKLTPEYEKAAERMKVAGVPLVAVDATVESSLASRFSVRGYPTLKWFPANDAAHPVDYDGPRDATGIVDWIQRRMSAAGTPGDNLAEPEKKNVIAMMSQYFEKFLELNPKGAMVTFYKGNCPWSKKWFQPYEESATTFKGKMPFSLIDVDAEPEMAKTWGVPGTPFILFFKDGAPMQYDGTKDSASLTKWIKQQTGEESRTPPVP